MESGKLLQEWLLRAATNIKDMHVKFFGRQQTRRIVEERELSEPSMEDDESFAVGSLCLPNNFADFPTYWKRMLPDGQAIVSVRLLPSPILTISMNPLWEGLRRMGIALANPPGFIATGTQPRLSCWPDIAALVHN